MGLWGSASPHGGLPGHGGSHPTLDWGRGQATHLLGSDPPQRPLHTWLCRAQLGLGGDGHAASTHDPSPYTLTALTQSVQPRL